MARMAECSWEALPPAPKRMTVDCPTARRRCIAVEILCSFSLALSTFDKPIY
jgi:hypothetical protein